MSGSEIIQGLWRFEAVHPEWTEDVGADEGWDRIIAWWALGTTRGLLLVDPLVFDWEALDEMVGAHGGCAGVVRTIHFHQRSVAEAADRYGVDVWARPSGSAALKPLDRALEDGAELLDGIRAFSMERADEVALWLPGQQALLFGDAMLRSDAGQLRVCPESWTQPEGGPARLRALIGALTRLPVTHVLVCHGPLVMGDGPESLRAALA